MNFFGHAAVATLHARRGRDAGFVLGAMLPDFATMIGSRVPVSLHDDVTAGIAFHHATDHVFHESVTFRALQADARRTLRERGLARPGALAVGHIGVEILLDAVLAEDARARLGYRAALESAHPDALGRHVEWPGEGQASAFARLAAVLVERVPEGAPDVALSAARIARALAPRPRLCLSADGERIVQEWAVEASPVVARAAEALLLEVMKGLMASGAELDMRPLLARPWV